MKWLLLLPSALQGGAMLVDELYFHRKRGLSLWERIGHPADTLSALAAFAYLVFAAPEHFNLQVYLGLAVFSCLLVTKDEFIHTRVCTARENWLHSVLFVIHPVVFLSAFLIWRDHANALASSSALWFGLQGQVLLIFAFALFQAIYWNFGRGKT